LLIWYIALHITVSAVSVHHLICKRHYISEALLLPSSGKRMGCHALIWAYRESRSESQDNVCHLNVNWLTVLTLSVGLNRGIAFHPFHLRRETDPIFEKLCSVLDTRWWTNSRHILTQSQM